MRKSVFSLPKASGKACFGSRAMHEFASKAATEESTAGPLEIMDDIASRRAAYMCGLITALFAGGLGLALLAGRPDAERIAAPISTATISAAPDRVPDSPPAVSAAENTLRARKELPDTIEDLTDKGRPGTATVVDGEPETPLPTVGDTMLPSRDITGVEPEEPALSASSARRQVSIKQRRAKARTTAARTAASSAPQLYSPNKNHQVPSWAAKMFEANWQPKAFAYQ